MTRGTASSRGWLAALLWGLPAGQAAAEARYVKHPGGRAGFEWLRIPPLHKEAELFPVAADGAWGFIDAKGRVVVEPQYDAVRPFVGGAAAVRVGRKWGVIVANGRMLVEPTYDDAGIVSEGMLAVRKGALWSYLSAAQMAAAAKREGAPPDLDFRFEPLGDFHEGYAIAYLKRTPRGESVSVLTYLSKSLEAWAPGRMEPVTEFADGLAAVRLYQDGAWRPGISVVDASGRVVGERPEALMTLAFSQGLAAVDAEGGWGYIDTKGHWAVRPRYKAAGRHAAGLAAVSTGDKWGYIGRDGELAIPARYTKADGFSEGLAAVCEGTQEAPRCGFIDPQGRTVVALRYRSAWAFAGGVALVLTPAGEFKYIGKGGRDVHAPAFTQADLRRLE